MQGEAGFPLVAPPAHYPRASPDQDAYVENPSAFEVIGELKELPEKQSGWRTALDAGLFVALVISGIALIYYGQNQLPNTEEIGNVFFNAGLTPLLLGAWALLLSWGIKRREYAIKTASGGLLFLLGLYLAQARSLREAVLVLGPALFEIGALFFINKMFFLGEDDEKTIQDLHTELEEARRSPGMGLALAYFYNFVLPTASHFLPPSAAARTPVDVELEPRGKLEAGTTKWNELVIMVPRDLHPAADMKQLLRRAVDDRVLLQAKPQPRPDVPPTHRPMFAYAVNWDAATRTCRTVFDMPTIISSIMERARERYQQLRVDVRRDLRDFQNRLFQLVRSHPATSDGRVRIVSVPRIGADFDIRKLAGSFDQLAHGGTGTEPVVGVAEESSSSTVRRSRRLSGKSSSTQL